MLEIDEIYLIMWEVKNFIYLGDYLIKLVLRAKFEKLRNLTQISLGSNTILC